MTSLVTRCPACSTHFKVVPDQLRISDGWVRCGQCDEVFDAQANMQPSVENSASGADAGPMGAHACSGTDGAVDVGPAPVDDAVAPASTPLSAADVPLSEQSDAGVDEEPVSSPAQDTGPLVVADAAVEDVPWRGESVDLAAPVIEVDAIPVEDILSAEPAPSVPSSMEPEDAGGTDFQPSFLQYPKPSSQPSRHWVRFVSLAILGLLFLLQVVVQQRDRIAATEPAFTPGLELLCQVVGCQIAPLRQIESIVIESSSFIKVKADVYRLSFSIKNTAPVPLALPFAELALTDLRDQSVLRRVLAPSEYGAQAQTLVPGEELTLVVPLAVKATPPVGDKVTGYRLLVFYP